MDNNELQHYGIIGMKWGQRRANSKISTIKKSKVHDDYQKNHSKKNIKKMSDQELRDRNSRLQSEKQYKQLTERSITGKKFVTAFVATATTIVAVENATKIYSKYGKAILNTIGGTVVN